MNLIVTAAIYKGDDAAQNGHRTLRLEIPNGGPKPKPVPLFLLPSFAAGDTCVAGVFEPGTNLLVNGKLYPSKEDGRMYVVPTQPLQSVSKVTQINQVFLSGGVGFIGEQYRDNVFNFGLMCQASPQKTLGHTWNDSLGFRIESWEDDAKRMQKYLYVGRQISLGGSLRFDSWVSKDGDQKAQYKVRIRGSQYAFFGKSKKEPDNVITTQEPSGFESPHQQAIAQTVEQPKLDDGIPF